MTEEKINIIDLLAQSNLSNNVDYIDKVLNTLEGLIGDTAVSSQINMAMKSHTHDYVSIDEFNKLKAEVEKLTELIGDTSVAEQINSALKR